MLDHLSPCCFQRSLSDNKFSGQIPEEICSQGDSSPDVDNNHLCPPYPACIDEYVEQDTTNCTILSITNDFILKTYSLSSPYPNPFNPTTTISFSIPQSDFVSINVYDIKGELITELINEKLHIGYHSINWDGTNQSSGMYLVRMESGDYFATQKLLLVK